MPLSNEQIKQLLGLVSSCESDPLDCDGCFEHVAEFAELELAGQGVPEALEAVKRHLDQCPCCCDEYAALLEGLREMRDAGEVS